MKKLILMLFVFSTIVNAEDNLKKENPSESGIIQNVSESVADGIKSVTSDLPDDVKSITDELADDVKFDASNSLFNIKLTNLTADYYQEGGPQALTTVDKDTLIGTIGLHLLPNTWNVDISYSGKLGNNLIAESDVLPVYNAAVAASADVATTASEKDLSWFDFYMKPINTSYGNVGFGYRSIEEGLKGLVHRDFSPVKILDVASGGGAYTTSAAKETIFSTNYKISRYYVTYNIPTTNKWYNGLGVTYAYEKSNYPKLINDTSFLLNPNKTAHSISFGIDKSLDEVGNGFSIKTLAVGTVSNKYSYYNFDTSQNETLSTTDKLIDIELVYMFKAKNHRQYHFLMELMQRQETTGYTYGELKFELGLRF